MRFLALTVSVLPCAVFITACTPPEPEAPPTPQPVLRSILPAFAADEWCSATYDDDADGTVDFTESLTLDAKAQRLTYTARNQEALTTKREFIYRAADGRELDRETSILPDGALESALDKVSFGHGHFYYDEQLRVALIESGGGDFRQNFHLRAFTYDERGRTIIMRDDAAPEVESFLPSQTDFFTYDDEDRVVLFERDVGNDGSIDTSATLTHDGLTSVSVQDNPPMTVTRTEDGFGHLVSGSVDDGSDGTIEYSETRVLDSDGVIAALEFDFDGDGTVDYIDTYTHDEATKSTTVEGATTGEFGFVPRVRVFDYSCLPFTPPENGNCPSHLLDTSIGCAAMLNGPALDFGRQRHFAGVAPDGTVFTLGGAGSLEGTSIIMSAEHVDVDDRESQPDIRSGVDRIGGGSSFAQLPDGRVLILGGIVRGDFLTSASFYDPAARAFSDGPALLAGRFRADAVTLDDGSVLWVGGAITATDLFVPPEYTPTSRGELPGEALFDPRLVALAGARAVRMGGAVRDTDERSNATFVYDAGEWTEATPLNVARSAFAAVALDGERVLVVGGTDDNDLPIDDVELWTSAGTTVVAALPVPLADVGVALLDDGTVFVAGGRIASARQGGRPETFIYDPANDGWRPGPPMFVPRSRAAVVVLDDGRPVVVGGSVADAQTTVSVEVLERQ
jgi:hypothetical protein